MSDPQHASQLIRGFYGIEQSWRWTQKKFSVSLVAPEGSAQKGALLHFRFAVPEPVIQNLKSVTLSAMVNGFNLKPETYEKPGEYTYARQVPAEQMRTSPVSVDFTLNRALLPSGADKRELGIVASEIGLTASE